MAARSIVLLLALLSIGALVTSCKSCMRRAGSDGAHGAVLAKGQPLQEATIFRVAIYYADQPAQPPEAALRSLATTLAPTLRVGLSKDDTGKAAGVAFMQPEIAELPPPDSESLSYFGRGLSRSEIESLSKAKRVFALAFSAPAAQALEVHASALTLSRAVAEATKGFLWDASTREAFSIPAWTDRIEPMGRNTVDIRHAVTNHAYEKDGAIRIVTLGMEKFGLPDVVVDGVRKDIGDDMTRLVYATCQALLEGTKTGDSGILRLSLDAYKSESFRNWLSLGSERNRKTSVTLADAKPDDGDPERVVALVFPASPGASLAQRQESAIRTLLGDRASKALDGDPELEAARQRATKRLLALKPVFQKGLAERESLSVKAAIGPAGHKEYMWMDVKVWEGDRLRGTLTNEPMDIPNLHQGAAVEITESDLFDFLLTRPDGSFEGGETSKILKERER